MYLSSDHISHCVAMQFDANSSKLIILPEHFHV